MKSKGSLLHLQDPATCPYPEPDQCRPCPHPISWSNILISYLRPDLPSCLFPSGFPTKVLYTPLLVPLYVLHAPPISLLLTFDHPNNVWWGVHFFKLLGVLCLHTSVTWSLLGPNTLLNIYSSLWCWIRTAQLVQGILRSVSVILQGSTELVLHTLACHSKWKLSVNTK